MFNIFNKKLKKQKFVTFVWVKTPYPKLNILSVEPQTNVLKCY